jgi:hypothetical protein
MPVNHDLELTEEFEVAKVGYNQILQEMI